MKRVTLADIVHEAGVHQTTVARALRNSPRIGTPKRKLVDMSTLPWLARYQLQNQTGGLKK